MPSTSRCRITTMLLLLLFILNFVKAAVLFDNQKENPNLSLKFPNLLQDTLCDQNDIYILDGERTLVITSHKNSEKDNSQIGDEVILLRFELFEINI